MKREKIVFIIGLISILIGSIVSVSAVTYLYNANEVSYDNSTSHLNSTDVQGAINELYDTAQDYSSMNTRVSALENRWSSSWNVLRVNRDGTSDTAEIYLYDNNLKPRGAFYYAGDTTYLSSANSSGTFGAGELNLRGNPVKINGVSVPKIYTSSKSCSSNTSGLISLTDYFSIPSNAHGIVCESKTSHNKVSQAIWWNSKWYVVLSAWDNNPAYKTSTAIDIQCTWMVG